MNIGKFLILLVTLVTVPRFASAFRPIDDYLFAGMPVTALGMGLAMGLGTYFVIITYHQTQAMRAEYRAEWEAHDRRMAEQGKKNRRPSEPPGLKSAWTLYASFVALLALAVAVQSVWVLSRFRSVPVEELLKPWTLGVYSFAIVLAPEALVFAVSTAIHFRHAMRQVGKKGKRAEASFSLTERLAARFLPVPVIEEPMPNPASISVPMPEPNGNAPTRYADFAVLCQERKLDAATVAGMTGREMVAAGLASGQRSATNWRRRFAEDGGSE
jgi:hypothetical protein